MPKKKTKNKSRQNEKLFAFLAVLLTIVGFIIALIFKKDNKYVMFYAKQGLILFILQIAIGIIDKVPIIGWFILGPILWVFFIVIWIMAWINALSGEKRNTLLIGDFAKNIKI
jgi:uncharacterized membrane protein